MFGFFITDEQEQLQCEDEREKLQREDEREKFQINSFKIVAVAASAEEADAAEEAFVWRHHVEDK